MLSEKIRSNRNISYSFQGFFVPFRTGTFFWNQTARRGPVLVVGKMSFRLHGLKPQKAESRSSVPVSY